MGKIAMGRAIGDAYDFAFGKYRTIFGVVWLPLLLIAAGEYWLFFPVVRSLPDFVQYAVQHPHERAMPPQWLVLNEYIALLDLAAVLAMIWIRVGVTKAALGLPRGPRFAYFFVGMDEVRVIGAYLVFIALIYGASIAAGIVIGIAAVVIGLLFGDGAFGHFDPAVLTSWAIGAAIAAGVALLGALIYVQARLAFLLVPVTVSEKRFGLWRSWALSKGNFWRIVVIAIGTVSPLVLLEFVLILALYIPVIVGVIATLHQHPEFAHNRQLLQASVMAAAFKNVAVFFPVGGLVGLVLAPIFFGLTCSPSAFVYRSLTEKAGGVSGAGS